MKLLELTADHDAAIRAHAERIYPHECCGFLLGRFEGTTARVERVLPAVNERGEEERHNRFTITPAASMKAEKQARAARLDIIGHYHSHPDHPARPSPTDLAHATWPNSAFVIVAVAGGKSAALTCWDLADDRSRFEAVDTRIVGRV